MQFLNHCHYVKSSIRKSLIQKPYASDKNHQSRLSEGIILTTLHTREIPKGFYLTCNRILHLSPFTVRTCNLNVF